MGVGVGIADDNRSEHINAQSAAIQPRQAGEGHRLLRAVSVPDDAHRSIPVPVRQKDLAGSVQLPGAPPAARVIEHGHKIAGRRRLQTPFNLLPGREQIAEADGAEILHQWRPQQRGGRLQSGNAGNGRHRRPAAVPAPVGQDAIHRPRHTVNAGIPGGYHRHLLPRLRQIHGQRRPFQLLPQLHRMPRRPAAAASVSRLANLLNIVAVADQSIAVRNGGGGGRRQMGGIAGPQPDQVKRAGIHGFPLGHCNWRWQ